MATIRIKKRLDQGGASGGAPSQLKPSELAFNEVDNKLYYGLGESGGNASSIIAIGGDGGFLSLSGAQTAAGNKTFSNDVVISGNLTVNGTTTSISSSTIDVEDKNIEIGKVSSPSDTTADGGGLTLKGASDKTFNWVNSTDAWTSSEHIDLASGKVLKVNGTQILSASEYTGNAATASSFSAGSAANLNSGTIPAARIGDDSIVEGKLDIHNSPSTNKILRYTSNGMEWDSEGAGSDTTYTHTWVDSSDDAILRLTAGGSGSGNDDLTIVAGSNITLTPSGDNLTIAATDTNTTYSVGDGGLTQNNFTNTLKSKLDAIESSATADQTKSDIDGLGIAASTAATLATARNLGGVSFNGSSDIDLPGVNSAGTQNTSGTAAIATTVTVGDESSDTTCFPLFATTDSGNTGAKTGSNLTFNSSTGVLAATQVDGLIDGGTF